MNRNKTISKNKKNIPLFLNTKFKIFALLYILSFISILGCSNKNVYLFNNKEYYTVFDEQFEIHKLVKKKLNRYFFKIKEININSFQTLTSEMYKIKNNNEEGLFFLSDFLTSLIIKNAQLVNNSGFELLTYNIPYEDVTFSPQLPIFNVSIDRRLFKAKLLKILRKYSKKKNDLSDCGIIINTNYSLCNHITNEIIKDGYNLDLLKTTGDKSKIKNWIKGDSKKSIIVFFGYQVNEYILELKKDIDKPLIYIEALTHYGEISNNIEYRIDINWKNAINYAIDSKEFRAFSKKQYKENEIHNFIADQSNVIRIHKYKKLHFDEKEKTKKVPIKDKDVLKEDIIKDDEEIKEIKSDATKDTNLIKTIVDIEKEEIPKTESGKYY